MVGRVRQRSYGFARAVVALSILALVNFGLWAALYFLIRSLV
jgi:hypothetical protein